MGQFKIEQDEGLAGKFNYLKQQWLSLKEPQPFSLNKATIYEYTDGITYTSRKAEGAKGVEAQMVELKVSFYPDNREVAFLLPEVHVSSSMFNSQSNMVTGGLKTPRLDSEGKIYYETIYTSQSSNWDGTATPQFEMKFRLKTPSRGLLKIERL